MHSDDQRWPSSGSSRPPVAGRDQADCPGDRRWNRTYYYFAGLLDAGRPGSDSFKLKVRTRSRMGSRLQPLATVSTASVANGSKGW